MQISMILGGEDIIYQEYATCPNMTQVTTGVRRKARFRIKRIIATKASELQSCIMRRYRN